MLVVLVVQVGARVVEQSGEDSYGSARTHHSKAIVKVNFTC